MRTFLDSFIHIFIVLMTVYLKKVFFYSDIRHVFGVKFIHVNPKSDNLWSCGMENCVYFCERTRAV